MSASAPASHAPTFAAARPTTLALNPAAARTLLVGVLVLAGVAGFVATSPAAASAATTAAGRELTHLLRAMAGLKALFAAGAAAVTYWRLGSAITWPRLAAYALAVAAMAAGPGLIWDMAHVRLGAALLHGGLFATVVLLWRDPAMSARLSASIAARRARLAQSLSARRETPARGGRPCLPSLPGR